jgi:hypothetical protein
MVVPRYLTISMHSMVLFPNASAYSTLNPISRTLTIPSIPSTMSTPSRALTYWRLISEIFSVATKVHPSSIHRLIIPSLHYIYIIYTSTHCNHVELPIQAEELHAIHSLLERTQGAQDSQLLHIIDHDCIRTWIRHQVTSIQLNGRIHGVTTTTDRFTIYFHKFNIMITILLRSQQGVHHINLN